MKNFPIQTNHLRLLAKEMNILDLLESIDIENIEDHNIKVICRTILHSTEVLLDLLDHQPIESPEPEDISAA